MPPAFEFRGNDRRSHNNNYPRHEFTFRYARPATAERPLLTTRRETTPEPILGAKSGDEKPVMKFAPISSLSDSEEAEMDMSDDDKDDEASHPRKKRALGTNNATAPTPAAVTAPKWSNPDPYTVLPPPDETLAKRVDVVKLIRKARIAANAKQTAPADAVTTNEDFISFSGLVDEEEARMKVPDNAPSGPKRLQGRDAAIGSRKRTHDDEIKGYSKKTGRPMVRFYDDGSIIDEWRSRPHENATPWMSLMEPSLHLGSRLHNEILSFYHWVKPVEYEQIVRADLVTRLQVAFQSRYYGVQLRPFGSFASGLYLPTADIDLVLLSSNFVRNGIKTFGERKGQIYAFAAFLKNLEIAVPNSIETIAHARVPILKFVDKMTGLRVDLSFDNDSGLIANNTFQNWKSEYPAMPVIVSVVKQFLLLRGLNEVPTGGLGGFSITCLVTSLLQHLPHGHTAPNLGSILMDFFEFYGNNFDFENVGIRMNPPGYFNKRVYKVFQGNNDARLSIEDPNNPDNDVSGGTREIHLIFKSFSKAFQSLKERMVSSAVSGDTKASILQSIIAANYEEYTQQRSQLRAVFETHPRFAQYHRAPTPPPPPPDTPPPPPADLAPLPPNLPAKPPSAKSSKASSAQSSKASSAPASKDSKDKMTKMQRKQQASRERAARLRRLRPEISAIPNSISNEQALSLGGYKSQSEMDKDLAGREREMK